MQPHQAEIKIKGSRFLAEVHPLNQESDYKNLLEAARAMHPKAVHHCWAYKWGVPVAVARSADDGEPAGTAGKPILGQLDSAGLTNVVAIVTRYFGGTLLGTGGLRKAYKEAVKEALIHMEPIEVKRSHRITIQFDIFQLPQVMAAAKRFPGEIIGKSTSFSPYVQIYTEVEDLEHEIAALTGHILNLSPEHAMAIENPGFKITIE